MGAWKIFLILMLKCEIASNLHGCCWAAFYIWCGCKVWTFSKKIIYPQFYFVSRNTIISDCFKVFTSQKNNFQIEIGAYKATIVCTLDMWQGRNYLHYYILTTNWIDTKFTKNNYWFLFYRISTHWSSYLCIYYVYFKRIWHWK